ncbi:RnfABCDGE type electron transport complex subunit D [Phaeovulum sp.]|uniref:RnfABCDGE type electron transport complex subunit D n=1 Tax=Phaeovulum sp. TaxID=2934796 RepID=UPI00356A7EDD
MSLPEPILTRVWDANRLVLVSVIAILAPLTALIAERGSAQLVPLALALGVAAFWHLTFSLIRNRPLGWDGAVIAMIFVVLVPASVPLWQQGLALSFGLVMGDLVFGGRGRGFLSAATVGLAFLLFSFPVTETAPFGTATVIAALGSGALLLYARILSWRVVAGFLAAMLLLSIAMILRSFTWPLPPSWPAEPSAALILGLVFLIGDPVAAASTNAGRWPYGFLAGVLVFLLGHSGQDILPSLVFAALLASVFAPLIDQVVIWANTRRRERRQRSV